MNDTPGLGAADLDFDPPRFAREVLDDFAAAHWGVRGTLTPLDGERDQNHCLRATDGRLFVLKVSGAGEDPGAVDFQVGALDHLEHHAPELPVPRVLRSQAGNAVEWIEDTAGARHMVRLLSWLPGIPFSKSAGIAPGALRHIARFQAGLAHGLRGYFHPHARHFVAWDIQRALVLDPGVQAHAGADARALCAPFLAHLRTQVMPRLPALRAQVIHGDAHSGNVLRADAAADEVAGVIDFGDMVHAPLVQDVAVLMASYARYGAMSLDTVVPLLEAYNAVLPLDDAELELLHDLVLLRLVTALFLYDFRLATTRDPPAWLRSERPDIVTALTRFLGYDRAMVLARYRAACGRAVPPARIDDAELIARRKQALGPSYRLFYSQPLHLVRGEGAWLWDAAGRRYLDAYNNVASVGHCHPHVVAALASQAATLNTHTRYLHENVVLYAERLTALLPEPLSVCMLVCTGTEANDLAIRIARTVTGRNGVIVSDDAYHGNSNVVFETSTCMYPPEKQPSWLATIAPPNGYRGPIRYGEPELGPRYAAGLDGAIARLEARGEGTACYLCDTIFDSNGTIVPPPGFLEGAAKRVRAAGGLFIADEVQAGFHRTGTHRWGFEHGAPIPDIVTLGKPIGDGHPLAAVITTPAIAAAFARDFSYFNTFGGNPVSAAVGMAVLDVIEREQLGANVVAAGAVIGPGLAALQARYRAIGDVRGSGLFWGIELVADRDSRAPDTAAADRLVDLMREAGVLIGRTGAFNNVVKIRPPLVFSPAQAGLLLAALDDCLARL